MITRKPNLWQIGLVIMAILMLYGLLKQDPETKPQTIVQPVRSEPIAPVKLPFPQSVLGNEKYNPVYRSAPDGAVRELEVFKQAWDFVAENQKDSLNKKWVKKLQTLQAREMPGIRKAFAETADNLLWEFDIRVTVSGTGNTSITFIGGEFVTNANKKRYYERFAEKLRFLRFKRICFKWYKEQDEYTYFDLKPDKDIGRIWQSGL